MATPVASWVLVALPDMTSVVASVVVALAALAALPFHLLDLLAPVFSLLATSCWMASQWGQLHAK